MGGTENALRTEAVSATCESAMEFNNLFNICFIVMQDMYYNPSKQH